MDPVAGPRLSRIVAPLTAGAGGTTAPPAAAAADVIEPEHAQPELQGPPRLLSDSQVQSFVESGFLALQIDERDAAWHTNFAQRCAEWTFQGTDTPGVGRHSTHVPELSELCALPTVSGALCSLLGEDYIMYPNRMIQVCRRQDVIWVHVGSYCIVLVPSFESS
jgi:hypothetical protein